MGAYRIVQPWHRDVGRQSTLISEHHTAAAAFAEIDRLAAQIGSDRGAERFGGVPGDRCRGSRGGAQ